VLALGAIAVSSASAALPEFEKSGPTAYVVTVGESRFAVEYGSVMICKSGYLSGEVTGAKTVTGTWELKECEDRLNRTQCNTEGQSAGVIRTASLPGILVYASKATKEVDIVYNPYEETKEIVYPKFAKLTCGGVTNTANIRRTLVAHNIGPINKLTKYLSLRLGQSGSKPLTYENEKGKKVEAILEENWGGGYFHSTFEAPSAELLYFSRELKINA
jgi:hypothetical protein